MPCVKKVQAEDLSQLHRLGAEYVLHLVFLGAGPRDRKARGYVIQLVTVTDKAIREYNAGRKLLVEYAASSNRTRLYIEAMGHLENCINSVKRVLRFVEKLALHPDGPEVERVVRRLLDSYGRSITPLRDAAEHMDAMIDSGELREGAAHLLCTDPDGTYLEVNDEKLTFADLATLLRRLHELASECARFKEAAQPGALSQAASRVP